MIYLCGIETLWRCQKCGHVTLQVHGDGAPIRCSAPSEPWCDGQVRRTVFAEECVAWLRANKHDIAERHPNASLSDIIEDAATDLEKELRASHAPWEETK